MQIYEMRKAVNEAAQVQRRADEIADIMARLIKGRLRHVGWTPLADLKKELKNFNAHTGEWRP